MNQTQAEQEIKYRLAVFKIQKLLEEGLITEIEFKKIRKELIRKLNPVIGCLDE